MELIPLIKLRMTRLVFKIILTVGVQVKRRKGLVKGACSRELTRPGVYGDLEMLVYITIASIHGAPLFGTR